MFQTRNEQSLTISDLKSDKRDSLGTNVIRNVQLEESETKKWRIGEKERAKLRGELMHL
ncbi:hypothetical protein X777_10463 [Ooceraea biroi]|uniref:Uncharacterized protein n=1 Tax=Ooceraea biroi TaxID=2015173 RepID=A0A026W414_OOCBI|nr:hypothetical protein X777_10463 [Ooceraea biroi]